MPLSSMRRRVTVLETIINCRWQSVALTPAEIEDIGRRLEAGESLQADELARLERHGRICIRNMSIWIHRGQLNVKRILGIAWENI
jgi:hypothetical protein